MKGRQIRYSPDELRWIEAQCHLPRRDLHAGFCKTFKRSDVKVEDIKALCSRRRWNTGRTGHFEKGSVPANKGKPCPPGTGGNHPNARRTQFKPGSIPQTYRGPGYERICDKDGYVILIVAEKNPWSGASTRLVLKHRWLWEKKNGPVPIGHVLKCRDGNKLNTDPANWELISRAVLAVLNRKHNGLDHATAPAELKPAILTIAKLKHAGRAKVKARSAA